MPTRRTFLAALAAGPLTAQSRTVRSKGSGPWSSAATWENKRMPQGGDTVEILGPSSDL